MTTITINFTTLMGMTAIPSLTYKGDMSEGRQKALDYMAKTRGDVCFFTVASKKKALHYKASGDMIF